MSVSTPLHPLHPVDDAEWAASVAQALARRTSLWRALARHDRYERRPVRMLATPRFDAWVIGWAPGQAVELHDHGDAAGAIVVTEGLLTEVRLDRAADSRTRTRTRTDLGAGTAQPLPVGTIHEVWNAGASPATSIHVYTPALTHMGRYDLRSGRRIGTEAVAPQEPALPSAVSGLLLHPAG
jgi:predicted metal-dependent enzyme (double-stranded beta helix superfamily)